MNRTHKEFLASIRALWTMLVILLLGIFVVWGVAATQSKHHGDEESRFYDRIERQEDQRLNLLYAQCEREVKSEGSTEPGLLCSEIGHETRGTP